MKKLIILLAPLMFFFSCQDDFTDDLTLDPTRNDIEIESRGVENCCFMTWNTGLIDPLTSDQDSRSRVICERIIEAGPDVITLQEVWDRNEQENFEECLNAAGYEVIYTEESGENNGNGLVTAVKREFLPYSIASQSVFLIKRENDHKLRKEKKIDTIRLHLYNKYDYRQDDSNYKELIHKVKNKMNTLSEQCIKIITSYYINNLTMKEIAKHFELSSSDVAKTLKSRCFKKLVNLVKV